MVFSSPVFVFLFLTSTLLLYYIIPGIKAKNVLLTVMSLIFYAWGEPVFVLLMLLCIAANYICAVFINKSRGKPSSKVFLTLGCVVSLCILVAFKYSGFLVSTFNGITGLSLGVPQIKMPIGISFYTFQAMSFTIDVYRGDVKKMPGFLGFMMYVSLFPQLVAGPIVRFTDIEDQIDKRTISVTGFAKGLRRFVTGLAKKLLIADYAYALVKTFIGGDLSSAPVFSVIMGMLFYSFYIYFDFSGYSDMAIGMGRMFGFKYPENFMHPYTALSVTDFWRRWHITLSTFFRDYVYIPLGGNRRGRARQVLNLFIVWALTGLWHGASWNFVLWGLYYFLILVLEKFVLGKLLQKLPRILRHIWSLLVVYIGWTIFYFESFPKLGQALSIMFGFSGHAFADRVHLTMLYNNIPFIIIAIIGCLPVGPFVQGMFGKLKRRDLRFGMAEASLTVIYNAVLMFLCIAALIGATNSPFLYFRF